MNCDGYEFENLECTKFEKNGNGINFFFGSSMPFLEEIDENVLYIALFELATLYEEFKKTGRTESFEEYPKFSDRAGTANLKWCCKQLLKIIKNIIFFLIFSTEYDIIFLKIRENAMNHLD